MREKLRKFKDYMFLLTCFVLYNPLIVKAAEAAETEQQDGMGKVETIIAGIIVIVVAYKVFHLMYKNTVLIGTKEAIGKEKIGMLVVPLICGIIVAAIALWLLKILFKIFIVLLIVAAIIGVIVFIVKMVSKKGNASAETSGEQMESKDAASVSVSASETENTIQSEGNVELVSEEGKTEIREDILENKDANNILRTIISGINIQDDYCETGTPIANSKMLEKARQNFEIPVSEKVYLIYDNTVLHTCKTGFAICDSGLYLRHKQQRYIPWAEFKTTEIANPSYLRIGSDEFLGVSNRETLYNVLIKVQGSVE